VVITVVSILTAYAVYHAQHPRVVVEKIAAPVKLRLVQISDLHLGSTRPGYTRRVVEEINRLQPDAVLATGDILDWPGPISDEGLAVLASIKAPRFAVTGNHEGYAGVEKCVAALRGAGFTVLRGDSVDFRGIRLYGFDDDSRQGALAKDLAGASIDPSAFNVLMFHHPRGFPEAARAGIKLMLSGHTHHGQIFPFSIAIDFMYDYPYGRYTVDGSTLYTSQGTGTWGPRMRLGTDGEITVFELSPDVTKP
jgi:predicted MPP superfamily phosphohydrolase